MKKDYGTELTEGQTETFGMSLLRVYRMASVALARSEDKAVKKSNQSASGEEKESY